MILRFANLLLVGSLILLITACQPVDGEVINDPPRVVRGKQLAGQYCGNCHLVPSPADLPRRIWATEVMPLMGAFHGIYTTTPREELLGTPEEANYLAQVFPTERLIDSTDWAGLLSYYIEEAPNKLPEAEQTTVLRRMDQFTVVPAHTSDLTDMANFTTMLLYDPTEKLIWTGGKYKGKGRLVGFNALRHKDVIRKDLSSPPTALLTNRFAVLQIGSLEPYDAPAGTLLRDTKSGDTLSTDSLLRPLDLVSIDLDLDGQSETVIAEYGNHHGRLGSYAKQGQLTVLSPTAGALRLKKADLDGDGNVDLLVLFAQGDERIEVYYARKGGPERRRLYRFPSTYGSSDMEVVDFDGDGDLDILTTNGDNFDYQPVAKPYHGIRLLENDGAANFTEAWFYPLDGAYGLEVDDFDGDGDQDIAAIAYFVPVAKRTLRSFVYLEQYDALRFHAFGFEKDPSHFYLCMAKGDTDGDGDQDLLLGNYGGYLPDGGRAVRSRNGAPSPAYLHLENKAVD